MRLSKQEALEGSYLNAIILLNQSIGDIRKKLKQGVVKGEEVIPIVNTINELKKQYLNESKNASPKKFNYDLP